MFRAKQVSRIQALQMDTAIMIPNSYIAGGLDKVVNVIGTKFSEAIKVERASGNLPVFDAEVRLTCTETGKFTLENKTTGASKEYNATSSNAVSTDDVVGIKITVTSGMTGVVAGDICDIYINGDSTYVVPGTVLGRIADVNSQYCGKFEPVNGADLSKYDNFAVCAGTVETDKQKLVPSNSRITQLSDTLTVSIYVFAKLDEQICRSINLTDDLKAKLTGIVWE